MKENSGSLDYQNQFDEEDPYTDVENYGNENHLEGAFKKHKRRDRFGTSPNGREFQDSFGISKEDSPASNQSTDSQNLTKSREVDGDDSHNDSKNDSQIIAPSLALKDDISVASGVEAFRFQSQTSNRTSKESDLDSAREMATENFSDNSLSREESAKIAELEFKTLELEFEEEDGPRPLTPLPVISNEEIITLTESPVSNIRSKEDSRPAMGSQYPANHTKDAKKAQPTKSDFVSGELANSKTEIESPRSDDVSLSELLGLELEFRPESSNEEKVTVAITLKPSPRLTSNRTPIKIALPVEDDMDSSISSPEAIEDGPLKDVVVENNLLANGDRIDGIRPTESGLRDFHKSQNLTSVPLEDTFSMIGQKNLTPRPSKLGPVKEDPRESETLSEHDTENFSPNQDIDRSISVIAQSAEDRLNERETQDPQQPQEIFQDINLHENESQQQEDNISAVLQNGSPLPKLDLSTVTFTNQHETPSKTNGELTMRHLQSDSDTPTEQAGMIESGDVESNENPPSNFEPLPSPSNLNSDSSEKPTEEDKTSQVNLGTSQAESGSMKDSEILTSKSDISNESESIKKPPSRFSSLTDQLKKSRAPMIGNDVSSDSPENSMSSKSSQPSERIERDQIPSPQNFEPDQNGTLESLSTTEKPKNAQSPDEKEESKSVESQAKVDKDDKDASTPALPIHHNKEVDEKEGNESGMLEMNSEEHNLDENQSTGADFSYDRDKGIDKTVSEDSESTRKQPPCRESASDKSHQQDDTNKAPLEIRNSPNSEVIVPKDALENLASTEIIAKIGESSQLAEISSQSNLQQKEQNEYQPKSVPALTVQIPDESADRKVARSAQSAPAVLSGVRKLLDLPLSPKLWAETESQESEPKSLLEKSKVTGSIMSLISPPLSSKLWESDDDKEKTFHKTDDDKEQTFHKTNGRQDSHKDSGSSGQNIMLALDLPLSPKLYAPESGSEIPIGVSDDSKGRTDPKSESISGVSDSKTESISGVSDSKTDKAENHGLSSEGLRVSATVPIRLFDSDKGTTIENSGNEAKEIKQLESQHNQAHESTEPNLKEENVVKETKSIDSENVRTIPNVLKNKGQTSSLNPDAPDWEPASLRQERTARRIKELSLKAQKFVLDSEKANGENESGLKLAFKDMTRSWSEKSEKRPQSAPQILQTTPLMQKSVIGTNFVTKSITGEKSLKLAI